MQSRGALAAADARDGSLVVIRHRQYSLQEQISHAIRPRALGRDMGEFAGVLRFRVGESAAVTARWSCVVYKKK